LELLECFYRYCVYLEQLSMLTTILSRQKST
jgi:hypothetical protein